MGKKPVRQQIEWQRAARERVLMILEQRYAGHQTRLANALGVTPALVSAIVRSVQPPTRNLMARLGAVEGINPHWAATGEGEPFGADTRGTLPVSDVLLPGPPASHPQFLTGTRFSVPPAYDRPSCYYWRLPNGHPVTAVAGWRLSPGDLLLLESAEAVISHPELLVGKKLVVSGRSLGRAEPVYGEVSLDEQGRRLFSTDCPILLSDDTPSPMPSNLNPTIAVKKREHSKRRNVIQPKGDWLTEQAPGEKHQPRPAERSHEDPSTRTGESSDPRPALPRFGTSDILALQLLMIRV